MNRAEAVEYIRKHFSCQEDYPWEKYPTYATFKHPENRKWFALVGDVEYDKLNIAKSGKVDFINLKNDPDLITSLRQAPGILPAYHMNKEHWLTALLDGSVGVELLKALIETSFEMTF